jgi:hypothetical protein
MTDDPRAVLWPSAREIALHEAAHVAVSHALGFVVIQATIKESENSLGGMQAVAGWNSRFEPPKSLFTGSEAQISRLVQRARSSARDPRKHEAAMRHMICDMAGPAADAIRSKRLMTEFWYTGDDGNSDFDRACQMATYAVPDADVADTICAASGAALALATRFWPVIEQIAAELQLRSSVVFGPAEDRALLYRLPVIRSLRTSIVNEYRLATMNIRDERLSK